MGNQSASNVTEPWTGSWAAVNPHHRGPGEGRFWIDIAEGCVSYSYGKDFHLTGLEAAAEDDDLKGSELRFRTPWYRFRLAAPGAMGVGPDRCEMLFQAVGHEGKGWFQVVLKKVS